MAKARAIVQRRQSVQNIKKITRTMELIATARFKKALDRATEAEAYTRKIAEIVADLGKSEIEASHPLLVEHPKVKKAVLLVVTSNRGLAGGYNGNVLRVATRRQIDLESESIDVQLEVAGKRGINFFRYRGAEIAARYTHFEDRPQFDEIDVLAKKYISMYVAGEIDRLDVVYTRFISAARQEAVVETLLPMTAASVGEAAQSVRRGKQAEVETPAKPVTYEFLPDPASILEEIVPVSFKVRLFKFFLDAAVSEQISRMIAMRGATENADTMVKSLTMLYNRARQAQITRELAEIIGGAAALE